MGGVIGRVNDPLPVDDRLVLVSAGRQPEYSEPPAGDSFVNYFNSLENHVR
jgi:hypothetical protein